MSRKINPGLILTALTAVLLVLAGGIASTGYAQGEREVAAAPLANHLTPTPTPIRTPTRTPPPTARPTSASSLVFSFDEIYYNPGFGGGGTCPDWEILKDELPANATLPYVWADFFFLDYRNVCAYGFPTEQVITAELYTPDGKRAAILTIPATRGTNSPEERELGFYMPYSLPYGTWMVVARGGSITARNTFIHPPRAGASIDVTHVLPGDVLHPYDPRWRMPYKQGDQAAVFGVGFRKNSEITVVVARSSDDYIDGKGYRHSPILGWTVQTDPRGDFHIQFPIGRSFKDGQYIVVVNPTSDMISDDGAWLFDPNYDYFHFIQIYTPWRACGNGPLSNLGKGGSARLSAGPPNNLRSQAQLTGRKIGQIQPYQSVIILDGPLCSDGMTWWYVEVTDFGALNNGLKGWTAEGNASGYWLLPSR